MKRERRKGDVLVAAVVLAWALVSVGCGPKVGDSPKTEENPSGWVSAARITGQYQPDVSEAVPIEGAADAQPAPTAADHSLRVMTYNVHFGEDVEGIARAIRENPALSKRDVLFVQEIQSYPDEGGSRASRLARALGMAYAYAPARTFESGGKSGTHGNAILSRFPLQKVHVMELPTGEIVVDKERRIALSADIQTSAGPLRLITVHLDTRLNANERILQLRPAIIDAPTPVVLGGDFNTNPMVWAFNVVPILPQTTTGMTDQAPILDDYIRSLNFQTPTAGFGPTVEYPGLEPRLDSIYIRGLQAGDGAVERGVTTSDHWPMWLDVKF